MKIYLTTSFRHKENIEEIITKVINYSRNEGHSINDIFPIFENDTDERPIQGKSIEDSNKVVKYIKNADIVVAELSHPSSGVGFEISLALTEKKPVLVLVHGQNKANLSALIKNNSSKYLTVKSYTSASEIEGVLKYFFKDAKEKIDTKFILIIPPEIDKYLEWNARERGIPKAEITRDAIEKIMQKDEKYQEHVKSHSLD
jgi:2'-deoxynucleoside 5'-phosphate N-hydrolase